MVATPASTDITQALGPETSATIIRSASTTLDPDDQYAVEYGRLCSLSLVSKNWQKLIKTTPSLWMPISPLAPIRTLNAVLNLTASGPLVVAQPLQTEKCTPRDNATALLTRLNRIKSLRMVINEAIWPEVASLLQEAAPRLETLELHVRGGTYTLPGRSFQGARPSSLRNLLLKGIKVPWDSPILSHLVSLDLSETDRPTNAEFADFLQRMPSLERLRLINGLPEKTEDVEVTARLPLLRYLYLHDTDPKRCAVFLRSTEMKPNKMHIVYEEDEIVQHNFMPTLADACIARLDATVGQCLVIKNEYFRTDWSLVATFTILASSEDEILTIELKYYPENGEEALDDVTDTVVNALKPALENVDVLKFEHTHPYPWEWGWLDAVHSSIPNLRRIEVFEQKAIEKGADDFFSGLADAMAAGWITESPGILVRA